MLTRLSVYKMEPSISTKLWGSFCLEESKLIKIIQKNIILFNNSLIIGLRAVVCMRQECNGSRYLLFRPTSLQASLQGVLLCGYSHIGLRTKETTRNPQVSSETAIMALSFVESIDRLCISQLVLLSYRFPFVQFQHNQILNVVKISY